MKTFRISYKAYKKLVSAAKKKVPYEIGGVFFEDAKSFIRTIPVTNISKEEGCYYIDIDSLKRILVRLKLKQWGEYHSHPICEAKPGKNDRRHLSKFRPKMNYQMIIDVIGQNIAIWSCRHRKLREHPIQVYFSNANLNRIYTKIDKSSLNELMKEIKKYTNTIILYKDHFKIEYLNKLSVIFGYLGKRYDLSRKYNNLEMRYLVYLYKLYNAIDNVVYATA